MKMKIPKLYGKKHKKMILEFIYFLAFNYCGGGLCFLQNCNAVFGPQTVRFLGPKVQSTPRPVSVLHFLQCFIQIIIIIQLASLSNVKLPWCNCYHV